jgi:hypothetical protein
VQVGGGCRVRARDLRRRVGARPSCGAGRVGSDGAGSVRGRGRRGTWRDRVGLELAVGGGGGGGLVGTCVAWPGGGGRG